MKRYELVTALRGVLGYQATVTEHRVLALIDAYAATERERLNPCRPWEQCEEIDFSVESVQGAGGIVWIRLNCSSCGNVQATAEPNDLGYLTAIAQNHFERKHPDLITDPPTLEVPPK